MAMSITLAKRDRGPPGAIVLPATIIAENTTMPMESSITRPIWSIARPKVKNFSSGHGPFQESVGTNTTRPTCAIASTSVSGCAHVLRARPNGRFASTSAARGARISSVSMTTPLSRG